MFKRGLEEGGEEVGGVGRISKGRHLAEPREHFRAPVLKGPVELHGHDRLQREIGIHLGDPRAQGNAERGKWAWWRGEGHKTETYKRE